ncbi:putative transcription factor, partial [Quercus suber]
GGIKIFGVYLQNNVTEVVGNVENNNSQVVREPSIVVDQKMKGEEHKLFLIGLNQLGKHDWKEISHKFETTKTPAQIGKRWTEKEHKLFLIGLNQLGKHDWIEISQKFVITKTPA